MFERATRRETNIGLVRAGDFVAERMEDRVIGGRNAPTQRRVRWSTRPGRAEFVGEREKISGEAQRMTCCWSDRLGDPLAELVLLAYLFRATEEALGQHVEAIEGLVHECAVPVELLEGPAGIGICDDRG